MTELLIHEMTDKTIPFYFSLRPLRLSVFALKLDNKIKSYIQS